jgi:outer membrane protein assembly factor BamE (lipoprotein component of BamABCDE complex)
MIMKRSPLILFFSLALLITIGCETIREATNPAPSQSQEEKNDEENERQIGKTEDQVIEDLGAPSKIETAGSYRIYYYDFDNGAVTKGFGRTDVTHRHFESNRFYFKNGKVVSWDFVEH